VNVDGSDLRIFTPWGGRVSHFDWRNDEEIVATFSPGNDMGRGHCFFHDGQDDCLQVGKDSVFGTGHCAFSPRGDWLASDESAATDHVTRTTSRENGNGVKDEYEILGTGR
jgi:hypothetical protein